jgi:hypothetical protein
MDKSPDFLTPFVSVLAVALVATMVSYAAIRAGSPVPGPAKPFAASRGDFPAPTPTNQADCTARKGLWSKGPGPEREDVPYYCTLPASDAGQRCFSSSECSSLRCEREDWLSKIGTWAPGVCAAFNMGGCVMTIDQGTAELMCE